MDILLDAEIRKQSNKVLSSVCSNQLFPLASSMDQFHQIAIRRYRQIVIRLILKNLVANLRTHHVAVLVQFNNQQQDPHENAKVGAQRKPAIDAIRIQVNLL